MDEADVLKKRGKATWYKEHSGDQFRHLAVFLGTDIRGLPIIQTSDEMDPITVGWDRLSEIFP